MREGDIPFEWHQATVAVALQPHQGSTVGESKGWALGLPEDQSEMSRITIQNLPAILCSNTSEVGAT